MKYLVDSMCKQKKFHYRTMLNGINVAFTQLRPNNANVAWVWLINKNVYSLPLHSVNEVHFEFTALIFEDVVQHINFTQEFLIHMMVLSGESKKVQAWIECGVVREKRDWLTVPFEKLCNPPSNYLHLLQCAMQCNGIEWNDDDGK